MSLASNSVFDVAGNGISLVAATAVTNAATNVFEPVGPPTNLRTRAGDRRVTLSWTAPVNTGGEQIAYYEYEQDGDGEWVSTGGTATSYTVTGLTNGQSYTFRVRAVTNSGRAGASSASASVAPRRPRPPPPPRRVVVRPTALIVAEGGSGEYTVVLTRSPTGPVTVELTVSGSPDVTALPVSLTFTASNWNAAQTVMVSAAHDGDAVDDTATVSHTVSGGGYGSVTAASLTVTITDDDERGVVVSPTAVTVAEGGSGEYTVVLTSEPTGPVTVEATVSGSPDVTALPAALTFTPSDWDAAQTVTVSAAHDGDAVDDTATVSHMVSGGGYGSVTASSVEVTVTEDETESTEVLLTLSPQAVSEGAGVPDRR